MYFSCLPFHYVACCFYFIVWFCYESGLWHCGLYFSPRNFGHHMQCDSVTTHNIVNILAPFIGTLCINPFIFQPIQLVSCVLEVASPGKIPAGKTEMPFEFPLTPRPNKTLYETYHGVFVNIQYLLRCEMKRSFLAKDLLKVSEFIVECKVGLKYKCKIELGLALEQVIQLCGWLFSYLRAKIDSC